MLKLAEARLRALELVQPLPPERVPLLDAPGRFLAEDVVAPRALPGCDNSAMDGFAVQAADTLGATRDRPVVLALTEAVYAGTVAKLEVGPGLAARIFTGAPIPRGADSVVRQEAARLEGGRVEIFVPAEPGAHVRRRGEEVALGDRVLTRAIRLDAHATALLAALGMADVAVVRSPRIAVVTLGDELVPLGAPADGHQVYESNGVMVAALARECGARLVHLERARDDDAEIRAALARVAGDVDLVVTAGGASVGDRDRIKHVLGPALEIDGVALKPGKPAGVARYGGAVVVVLPGNPGAAAAGFDQFVRPMLMKLQGAAEDRRVIEVRLDSDRHKQAGLTYLLAAKVELRDGVAWAKIPRQGAGQILQNVGAEGWVVLPPGQADFHAGERVTMELFSGATTRAA